MGSQWGYKCRYFPPFKIINSMEARSYRPLLLSFTFLIIITSFNNLIPINFPHSCLSQFVDKVMGKRSFFWDEEAKRRRRKSWTENVLTSTLDVRLMAARAYVWTDMTIMIGPGTMVMQPASFDHGYYIHALCALCSFCLFGLLSQRPSLLRSVNGRQIVYEKAVR